MTSNIENAQHWRVPSVGAILIVLVFMPHLFSNSPYVNAGRIGYNVSKREHADIIQALALILVIFISVAIVVVMPTLRTYISILNASKSKCTTKKREEKIIQQSLTLIFTYRIESEECRL